MDILVMDGLELLKNIHYSPGMFSFLLIPIFIILFGWILYRIQKR